MNVPALQLYLLVYRLNLNGQYTLSSWSSFVNSQFPLYHSNVGICACLFFTLNYAQISIAIWNPLWSGCFLTSSECDTAVPSINACMRSGRHVANVNDQSMVSHISSVRSWCVTSLQFCFLRVVWSTSTDVSSRPSWRHSATLNQIARSS